jgi:hypothetical protein
VLAVLQVERKLVGGAPRAVAVEEAALVHPEFGRNLRRHELLEKYLHIFIKNKPQILNTVIAPVY